jgi:hypothetical protein
VRSSTKAAVFGFERCGVLVEQQQARGLERSHQQADRLPLAAREQAHAVCSRFSSPRLEDATAGRGSARAVPDPAPTGCRAARRAPGQCQVLLDGQGLAGAGHRILEDARHQRAALPCTHARDVDVVEGDAAAVDEQVSAQRIEHRRLAGAVRADDGDELAAGDRQVEPAQRAVLHRGARIEGQPQIRWPSA